MGSLGRGRRRGSISGSVITSDEGKGKSLVQPRPHNRRSVVHRYDVPPLRTMVTCDPAQGRRDGRRFRVGGLARLAIRIKRWNFGQSRCDGAEHSATCKSVLRSAVSLRILWSSSTALARRSERGTFGRPSLPSMSRISSSEKPAACPILMNESCSRASGPNWRRRPRLPADSIGRHPRSSAEPMQARRTSPRPLKYRAASCLTSS